MSQPGLARAAAGAPRDVSSSPASSRSPASPSPSPSRPPKASSLPAKAARPRGLGGLHAPCGECAAAKVLHHAQALVGPHCVAPSLASSCSATVRAAAHACFKNLLNKIYIDKKLIDNSFIL